MTIQVLSVGTPTAGIPKNDKRIDGIIKQLGERNFQSAVDSLAEIGEPAVIPLTNILKGRSIKNWSVQARSINVLARIGTEQAIEVIVETLNDKDSNQYVRGFAAIALGETGSVRMIDPLKLGLKDEKKIVRWKCTQALGMFGREKCVDALHIALKDEDRYVRAAAVQSLGSIKSKEAGEVLMNALRDEHWLVRRNARNAMVEIGKPATRRLIESLSDGDPKVRWQAAGVLGRIKPEGVVAPLINATGDSNWMVRDEAAVSLVRLGFGAERRLRTRADSMDFS